MRATYFRFNEETGFALLVTLFALSLFSILGLYIAMNSTTSVKISDNSESRIQATYSSIGGINHARALLRGLSLNDLLTGPDGRYSEDTLYIEEAKTHRFRLPLPLLTARAVNVLDPSSDVSGLSDDGLISTGFYRGTNGTALIPATGIRLMAPNPYGSGEILTSRYFVKVTDNNGEASEIAGDPDNIPFIDGDGIVLVRSVGVARTISDSTGSIPRRNSVAAFEARLKRFSTWDLGSALVVMGAGVNPLFSGSYEISGGAFPGIGTIDTARDDAISLEQTIRSAAQGSSSITGGELPNPSVLDITARVSSIPDQSLLLNPKYLQNFIRRQAPKIADAFYEGTQNWMGDRAPYTGFYDSTKPLNAPGQDPRITVIDGDLNVSGNFSGGGLLIVTGNFSCSGAYAFSGLILVIGSGNVIADGSGQGIDGGLIAVKLMYVGEEPQFGALEISISGSSRFTFNRETVRMAIALIPPSQIGFREIAGFDP
jgi:hypothetical protein